MPKAYLRGLTQREEKQEGVDFFVQLNPSARIFAFQFKAPHGKSEATPYKYQLMREQHELLFDLAKTSPDGVFYVFPFYVTVTKLQRDVPDLVQDTWLLNVSQMPTAKAFGTFQSRTLRCQPGKASINPDYTLEQLHDMIRTRQDGVPARGFADWYGRFRELRNRVEQRGNPWLVRGLRVAIVQP